MKSIIWKIGTPPFVEYGIIDKIVSEGYLVAGHSEIIRCPIKIMEGYDSELYNKLFSLKVKYQKEKSELDDKFEREALKACDLLK